MTKTLDVIKQVQTTDTKTRHSQRVLMMLAEKEAAAEEYSSDRPFTSHRKTQKLLERATGFKGTLTERGFEIIVEKARANVLGLLDDNGYISEEAINKDDWGRLAANIVRLYVSTFGEGWIRTWLSAHGGTSHLESDRQYALKYVTRLLAPEVNCQGVSRSMVQRVIEYRLNVRQLTRYIQNALKGHAANDFRAKESGTLRDDFAQVPLADDVDDSSDNGAMTQERRGIQLYAKVDLEGELLQEDSANHVKQLIRSAFADLTNEQKQVLAVYVTPEAKEIYETRLSFIRQIESLHQLLDMTKKQSRSIAVEIVASLQRTLGVTIEERTVATEVPKSRATAMRIKKGLFNTRRNYETVIKELPDNECHSPFLTDRFVSGTRCTPFVVPSHVDELRSQFANRNVSIAQLIGLIG